MGGALKTSKKKYGKSWKISPSIKPTFDGFKTKQEQRKRKNQADFTFMARESTWDNSATMFRNTEQSNQYTNFDKRPEKPDGILSKVKFMFTRGR